MQARVDNQKQTPQRYEKGENINQSRIKRMIDIKGTGITSYFGDPISLPHTIYPK